MVPPATLMPLTIAVVLAALNEWMKLRCTVLVPLEAVCWIPVIVVAAELLVLVRVWMVFCEIV